MWENRNDAQHSEENFTLRQRSTEVNEGIEVQFDMDAAELSPPIRRLMNNPLSCVLRLSLADREDWLELVTLDRAQRRRALVPQRRMMFNHFRRGPSPS